MIFESPPVALITACYTESNQQLQITTILQVAFPCLGKAFQKELDVFDVKLICGKASLQGRGQTLV